MSREENPSVATDATAAEGTPETAVSETAAPETETSKTAASEIETSKAAAPETAGPPAAAPDSPGLPPRHARRNIAVALLILVALGLGVFGYWYTYMRGIVSTDDARIDGDLVDLAPQVGGELVAVKVREGDHVRRGQVLFTLDPALLQAALERAEAAQKSAEAALAQATAALLKARHGPRKEQVRVASEALQRTYAETRLATTQLKRLRRLQKQGAAPQSALDQARARWESSIHSEQAAADRLRMLKRGTRKEDLAAAEANVLLTKSRIAAARAAVSQARESRTRAVVVAPFDGIVVRRWKHPGAVLGPGTPVITLMNPATLHVSANVEEKDLADVSIGDRVDVEVDAFPGKTLRGRVTRILRATNSKFSLIPAEGVSGTFIKVTQRVNIRVDLDDTHSLSLSPGLSAEIRIHVGSAPPRSASAKAGTPRVATEGHSTVPREAARSDPGRDESRSAGQGR